MGKQGEQREQAFPESPRSRTSLKWVGLASWLLRTLAVAGSLAAVLRANDRSALAQVRAQALASYEKDVIYRRWNSERGGVYVPPTDKTPPNPWLDVPDRDLTTTDGRELTLMNPAYMTRLAHELQRASRATSRAFVLSGPRMPPMTGRPSLSSAWSEVSPRWPRSPTWEASSASA